jgi:membrane dipeptidase
VIDHIEHIARVAGVEHVGLGSDFDGISAVPVGLEDVAAIPRIADALLDRGWSAVEIARVLGENMLRLL